MINIKEFASLSEFFLFLFSFLFFILIPILFNIDDSTIIFLSSFILGMFSYIIFSAFYNGRKENMLIASIITVSFFIFTGLIPFFNFFKEDFSIIRLFSFIIGIIFLFFVRKIIYKLFNIYKSIIVLNDKRLKKYCFNLVHSMHDQYITDYNFCSKYYFDWDPEKSLRDFVLSRGGWTQQSKNSSYLNYNNRKVSINFKYNNSSGLQILTTAFGVAEAELTDHIKQENSLLRNKIFEAIKNQSLQEFEAYMKTKQ